MEKQKQINKECSRCKSAHTYLRKKTMERICQNCGYVQDIDSTNQTGGK